MSRHSATSVGALVVEACALLAASAFTPPALGARNDWAEGTPWERLVLPV